MIVVTGATGKLGGQIVEALLRSRPPSGLAVSVREPERAQDLARRGVRVRRGDFSQPESLAGAFEGVTQLLLVSSNARAEGGDAVAQHGAAIAAARAAGVRRIVYTSHMGAGAASAFPPMHDHAATEALLREAGVPWTALRNGFYASTVPVLAADAAASGVLVAPQDGKVAWTAHGDLAEAAAAVLTTERVFEGPTPPLTATSALDLADAAALLSELRGAPIARRIIPDEEQAERMRGRGAPPAAIEITLGLFRAARAGEFAAVDPTLARLLGREPTPLRDVLGGVAS